MDNPWKLATFGILLVVVTAVTAGATTAYFITPHGQPQAPVRRARYTVQYTEPTASQVRVVCSLPNVFSMSAMKTGPLGVGT